MHVVPSGDLATLCVNCVVGHLPFACCYFRRFGPAMRQPHCGVICPLHVVLSGDLALLCVNHVAGHLHFARRSFMRFCPAVRQLRCRAICTLHVAPSGIFGIAAHPSFNSNDMLSGTTALNATRYSYCRPTVIWLCAKLNALPGVWQCALDVEALCISAMTVCRRRVKRLPPRHLIAHTAATPPPL